LIPRIEYRMQHSSISLHSSNQERNEKIQNSQKAVTSSLTSTCKQLVTSNDS
ncbi:77_t:CDS:1, partial [Acaulospora morrowiae]